MVKTNIIIRKKFEPKEKSLNLWWPVDGVRLPSTDWARFYDIFLWAPQEKNEASFASQNGVQMSLEYHKAFTIFRCISLKKPVVTRYSLITLSRELAKKFNFFWKY